MDSLGEGGRAVGAIYLQFNKISDTASIESL